MKTEGKSGGKNDDKNAYFRNLNCMWFDFLTLNGTHIKS